MVAEFGARATDQEVGKSMDDWAELDALVEELRQEDVERWHQLDELRIQLGTLQPISEVITRQFSELQVDAHLGAINDRLLGGFGSVEVVHSGAGIEYAAALVWPAHVGPHAPPEESEGGVYRIEVWLGPNLQDGRARIRIEGAKRLEATLPTSSGRFRAALLTVFRNPQFVDRVVETETTESEGEQTDRAESELETEFAFQPAEAESELDVEHVTLENPLPNEPASDEAENAGSTS
jgi:hypothetical protein